MSPLTHRNYPGDSQGIVDAKERLITTTDPQHERFDVCDSRGRPAGYSKSRGEIHRDGDWHRSLHLWVYGIEGEPFVLFQRRSMTKDTWPGALDVTVGGHIRAGEDIEETLREAEEEIGLRLQLADTTRIGRRFGSTQTNTYFDQEIQEVFAVRSDRPLDRYRLHRDELAGLLQISLADALILFRGERWSVPAREVSTVTGKITCREVAVADFVDASDGYAVLALEAIERLVAGVAPRPFKIQSMDN